MVEFDFVSLFTHGMGPMHIDLIDIDVQFYLLLYIIVALELAYGNSLGDRRR